MGDQRSYRSFSPLRARLCTTQPSEGKKCQIIRLSSGCVFASLRLCVKFFDLTYAIDALTRGSAALEIVLRPLCEQPMPRGREDGVNTREFRAKPELTLDPGRARDEHRRVARATRTDASRNRPACQSAR